MNTATSGWGRGAALNDVPQVTVTLCIEVAIGTRAQPPLTTLPLSKLTVP